MKSMRGLKNKRVFVTGASGFIGANLVRELIKQEASVYALVRKKSNLWRLKDLFSEVTLLYGDLKEEKKLKSIINKVRPQIIYHLAMPGGYAKDESSRKEAILSMVMGTFNLLESLEDIRYERFIYCASSTEYGARNRPLKETDILRPFTFRGLVKGAATLLCMQYVLERKRPITILRPFSVYGYWEQPGRLIPMAIKAFICNRKIKLTAGSFRHDFIFIEDVVRACLILAQEKKAVGEIFNIGSGRQWANRQVIELLERIFGHQVNIIRGAFPARAPDISCWVADIKKAKKVLGWKPRYSLEDGLRKTVEWFKLNQKAYIKSK